MALEIEIFLLGGMGGLIVGVIIARFYFKSRIETKNIGQVIEYAMVHKDIKRLVSMAKRLETLVEGLEGCSEDITNRLELVEDIEINFTSIEEEQDSN
jgi:hypothetical protein